MSKNQLYSMKHRRKSIASKPTMKMNLLMPKKNESRLLLKFKNLWRKTRESRLKAAGNFKVIKQNVPSTKPSFAKQIRTSALC